MTYTPPSPGSIAVIFDGGYVSPQASSLQFIVGGLETIICNGAIVSDLDSVTSSAVIGTISAGVVGGSLDSVNAVGDSYIIFGDVHPLADEVSGTATSLFAVGRIEESIVVQATGTSDAFVVTGDGVVTPRIDKVSGVAANAVNVGSVVAVEHFHGTGVSAVCSFGKVEPAREKVRADGYSGTPVFTAAVRPYVELLQGSATSSFCRFDVSSSIETVDGTGSTNIYARASISPGKEITTGIGSTPAVCVGTGRVQPDRDKITCSGLSGSTALGRVRPNMCVVSSTGAIVPTASGRIVTQKDAVAARIITPIDWTSLAYSSDQKPSTTLTPSSALQPLGFGRDDLSTGSSQGATTNPLSFSR